MVEFKNEKNGGSKTGATFSMQYLDKHQRLYTDKELNKELAVVVAGHLRKGQKFLVVLSLPRNKQEWRDGSPISKDHLKTIVRNLKSFYGSEHAYEVVFTNPSFSMDLGVKNAFRLN